LQSLPRLFSRFSAKEKTAWVFLPFVLTLAVQPARSTDSITLANFPLAPDQNPFSVVAPWPPREVPVGAFRVDTELRFEEMFHRLQPPETVTNATTAGSEPGLGKQFVKNTDPTDTNRPWTSGFGDQFTLAMQAHPTENTEGQATLAYQTDYADQYWLPLTDEHRMAIEGDKLRVLSGDFGYKDQDFSLRGFEAMPHAGWEGSGDLFGLYPAQSQYDIQKYRDYSGRTVPRGGEMSFQSPLGNLTLVGGPEITWGYGPAFFSLYQKKFNKVDFSYIAQYEEIPYGDPGEHMQAHSFTAGFPVSKGGRLEMGMLFQPFRLNQTYTHVDDVATGQGIGGSSVLPSQRTTELKDAFGGQVRYTQKLPYLIDSVSVKLQYLGVVAGNKEEFTTEFVKKVHRDYTNVFGFTYQAPLEGPVPYVFEGSPANQGAALLTPRGQDDPFQVNWSNREARIYSYTLTFDPTPKTSFYRYTPNVPEMWNLDPGENAPFAWALRYQASEYLTPTDHSYYVDASGNYIWEPPASAGASATSRPISEVKSLARVGWSKNMAMAIAVAGGESLATSSLAYNDTTDTSKPITDYLDAQIRFFLKPFTTWIRYGRDIWGPYGDVGEYQRTFGSTVHKLFEAGGEVGLKGGFVLGIRYVSVRENDNIFVPGDVGSFDEYRFSVDYRFGVVAEFKTPPHKLAPRVPKDLVHTEVRLQVGDPLFDASGVKARVPLRLKALPNRAVSRWELQVFNSTGQIVGTVLAFGNPPDEVLWDAIDIGGVPLPAGSYSATAKVWDAEGNMGQTPLPETFELRYPAHVSVESSTPVAAAPVVPYKVEQTAAGLKVTFTSSVLFERGRSVLGAKANEAIDQLVVLIQSYPASNLMVEGHTDSTGSAGLNARLSLARAQAVADSLIEKGIDQDRLKVMGRGASQPVASNTTSDGRALNRRVEITILKSEQ